MLLILLAVIMRFVDISKLQWRQRCSICNSNTECTHYNNNSNTDANGNMPCWQHVAYSSNSSSTSSGCDSSCSSKENFYAPQQQQQQQYGVTAQQLQQIRYYERLQQQQLQLLQQQLLQRRLQQQLLRVQGVPAPAAAATTTSGGLTCNQQYLIQQRLQQQQQQQQYCQNAANNNENDYLNNNQSHKHQQQANVAQGLKLRRGMTEFSTINNRNNISSNSSSNNHIKLLQNSPATHYHHTQHTAFNPSANPTTPTQQQHLLNRLAPQQHNGNTAAQFEYESAAYRQPQNSPSSVPHAPLAGNKRHQQQQQQLNDRLLQQQHLQLCQQQQLQLLSSVDANAAAAAERAELSEESLKQNVAIVLSNLERYNSTLRSIILNEQLSSNCDSSLFLCDDDDVDNSSSQTDNNNHDVWFNNNNNNNNKQRVQAMAATTVAAVATPESDYNSNATTPAGNRSSSEQQQQLGVGGMLCGGGGGAVSVGGGVGGACANVSGSGVGLNCSLASSQDFTHDNSDYQWFLDYGYRDGCGGMQRSVLSCLSNSFNNYGDLIYNDDLAKNLDANLAEVDMESFRAEDIHSLLSQLPAYCKTLGALNSSLQQSLLLQQQQQQQQQQLYNMHNMSQTSTTSTNELIDNSFCKSELLFSPVKESHISVDSLDMDAYPEEGDIILTCNKDNYTIAFEGSVLYSDDSFYEPADCALRNKQNCINLHSNLDEIVKRNKALEVSMSRSAQSFQPTANCRSPKTTKQRTQLQRYPSGNNNNAGAAAAPAMELITITRHLPQCSVRKSSSLPNLQSELTAEQQQQQQQHEQQQQREEPLNVSQALSTSNMETCTSRIRNLLPMCQMPISISASISERLQQPQAEQQQTHKSHHQSRHKQQQQQQQQQQHRCSCAQSQNSGSASSGNSNPAAFNLVKMFMKQKSSNSNSSCAPDEAQAASGLTCMDVSSGCWPSSDGAGVGSSCSSSSLEKRLRKKSMHDSGKGSAVSRHDEEELLQQEQVTPKRRSLACGSSPAAQRRRSMPLRNPQLTQPAATHCSQQSSEASNSEQLTQICKPLSCASSSEMITRSIQTSCGSLSTHSNLSSRYRCVPPSFLAKLHNLGEQREAPIYVIYPNYALPDLGFVQTSSSNDVIFSPFNYKMTMESAGVAARSQQSLNEDELLRNLDTAHIEDWQSLATLLPQEYRRRLQHIPELRKLSPQLDTEQSQRPLFCMSPPVRRNRSHVCDCAKYFQQQQQQQQDEASSSGSSQPPSSGYRGSSTLLTDSEVEADPFKQMYVYQYEQQQQTTPQQLTTTTTPPQPMPRGILRKAKRNSMIEPKQASHQQLSKLEKRRSLQEPPHNYALGSTDELAEVFEEAEEQSPPVAAKQRLSRKDLDARARAENFLASLPRSELKYYAEIAAILESSTGSAEGVQYDAAALKKEVSRVLSQQKKVSFNDVGAELLAKRFSTPPNSPNISMPSLQRRETLDAHEQRKIESNRFKRLQIQWELMSKDSSMLKELANEQATKSGGSTPTSSAAAANSPHSSQKSRIPRPVSYPAGRKSTPEPTRAATPAKTVNKNANLSSPQLCRVSSAQDVGSAGKCGTRSPSRMVQPKRYSIATTPTTPTSSTAAGRARTPNSRPSTASTPKRQAVAPTSSRPTSRVR
ncbi:uncharacterized protein LOC108602908 isoform X2 [Drosophila busckii]|uniref:uncharacterized protein LOC108602908 isoform X2 n=1 Tax=Drosophila busckii TaxID=30019 RepID=UPI00083EE3FD|nr:uncharacterized protein LOC108602908 isoform X2 [Drosophila busckii]